MKTTEDFLSAVRVSYTRAHSPKTVLAALSGGADSVALLFILRTLQKTEGFSLSAVHVNHHLRETASRDEAYCAALCKRLAVPLEVKHVQVEKRASLEDAAREARYAAFLDAQKETKCDVLALAHHMDDQAETVLMHLFRGAGAAGLVGMRETDHGVWRPLLSFTHDELVSLLQTQGISWQEDETNADTRYTRNAVRHLLMPEITRIYPKATGNLSRTAQIIGDEEKWWQERAEGFLKSNARLSPVPFMKTEGIALMPRAEQRRMIRAFCAKLPIRQPDFEQTERLCDLIGKNRGTENLFCGIRAEKTPKRLYIPLPDAKTEHASLHLIPFAGQTGDGRHCQAFDGNILECAVLRTRKEGDYIIPFGMTGRTSLKEYMIDKKIDRPLRDVWPILAIKDEVIWVIGVGAGECARIKNADTAVLAEYSAPLPDEIKSDDEGA